MEFSESEVSAGRLRFRFMLVCIMFGIVISFTGLANYYIHGVKERLTQALQLQHEQYLISQSVSDKFWFLLNGEGRVSSTSLSNVQRDLLADMSQLQESQINLENFIARSADEFQLLWPRNLTLESVKLEKSESDFIERMLLRMSTPVSYSDGNSLVILRPLEVNIVFQSTWRKRLADAVELVQQSNEDFSHLNQFVLLSTFLGLLLILLVAYATLFSPVFQRLRRASEISQLKLETHESLANFLKNVSYIGSILVENPQRLSLLLNRKIDDYPVLQGIRINLLDRKQLVLDVPQPAFVETIHQAGSAANYHLVVSLPRSLVQVKEDILPFVKALANHLSTLFEVQLRIAVEHQRDMYYQVTEAAFRALPSPIAIFDENGKGVMANPAFSSLFELAELQILSECSLAQIESRHRNMQKAAAKRAGEVFVPGQAVEFNVSYEHSTLVWTRLPMHEVGYVFIGHDVTQVLEHRSREERYRSLDYLGQMAGRVAHDTHHKLAMIMKTLELIGMSAQLNDKPDNLLQVAINTCQKASTMNSHMVSFTRKQNLAPARVSPKILVDKVELFLASEKYGGIELVLDIDKQAQIFADPLYLESALINVVKNGVESMAGHGQLWLSIQLYKADLVCLQVGDTGPGFTDEALKQALKPYYTGKVSGNGLGLAAVFGFASQSRGNVFLRNGHSRNGNGVEWRGVERRDVSRRDVARWRAIVELQLPRFRKNRKERGIEIFLLEDNEVLAEIIVAQLHSAGHRVRLANSLETASEVIQECTSLDVMVSDIILPDGQGFSAIRNIRGKFPEMKLIYTTGCGTEKFTDELKKEPGIVLNKPFRLNRLIQHIEEHGKSDNQYA